MLYFKYLQQTTLLGNLALTGRPDATRWDGRAQSLFRKVWLNDRERRPQVLKKRAFLSNNFPEEVCSRESWLYLTFSYRGILTIDFGFVAAANPIQCLQTRKCP